jgi:hypothetical protein
LALLSAFPAFRLLFCNHITTYNLEELPLVGLVACNFVTHSWF